MNPCLCKISILFELKGTCLEIHYISIEVKHLSEVFTANVFNTNVNDGGNDKILRVLINFL